MGGTLEQRSSELQDLWYEWSQANASKQMLLEQQSNAIGLLLAKLDTSADSLPPLPPSEAPNIIPPRLGCHAEFSPLDARKTDAQHSGPSGAPKRKAAERPHPAALGPLGERNSLIEQDGAPPWLPKVLA